MKNRLAAVFLLVYIGLVSSVLAQERCGYMTAIPRPPTPELDNEDFTGVPWNQRPLVPAPSREDVCMDQWVADSSTQIIYMEEEIEGDVSIAKLNYQGASTPTVVFPLIAGRFDLLGPEIQRIDNEWHLVITQRQDFETPAMRLYMMNINVPGEALQPSVTLQIVNIDDNPPVLQVLDPCRVDELDDTTRTRCDYAVFDADGEISTRFMTFKVESNRADDERIFFMTGQNIPNDWFNMRMIVNIREALNFETNALHSFTVTAMDSFPNNHSVPMLVHVQNVESRPPRWVEIFAVQQFDEKTVQEFRVRAIDGDTGIDQPINYTLIRDERDKFFCLEELPGGRDGAILHVDKIDRDTLEQEVFQLSIIAYKQNNASFATEAVIVIIVNDINDQRPEPLQKAPYRLAIMEETPQTLSFPADQPFGFHDLDLGENAQYSLRLEDDYPQGAAAAFQINPNVGYQRQTFIMSTVDHSLLDFEVPEFQHISIKVIATDLNNTDFIGEATVLIDLINWNDELPIFNESSYTVSFKETVPKGFRVKTVLATDRDIDDRVVHTLMGNAGEYLAIDEDTGDIVVSIDNAFDYHRQNVLFVQVRADDTLGLPNNTATTQLQIQLEDVNNTPPTLRLPRVSPSVEENVPEGYVITRELVATDQDTTAELVFEIDWPNSWATKQGRETPSKEFENCVEIETYYPDPEDRGSANGVLIVKEIRENVTIDFEEFEVLYLIVRVRDKNTVYGVDYDEATFTITIIDMNDNRPLFDADSVAREFRVREVAPSGNVVGSVLAIDIDGPLYNQVRYSIKPREDTPDGLVRIEPVTGQIVVDEDSAIDADEPPRYHLYYTITASDECVLENRTLCPPDPTFWETELEIQIEIIDTNNKVPLADTERFTPRVYIWENATTGDEIVQLYSIDLDRDEMYHTVRYLINFAVNPRLLLFFAVDQDSGLLRVEYTGVEVLDRDGLEPTHTIFVNLIDNLHGEGDGRSNQNDTRVEVILLDVNDNAPELPSPDVLYWSISEALAEGIRLQPYILAPDADEPDTPNSHVGYDILDLQVLNRDIEAPQLFEMAVRELYVSGELKTAMPLRGYWGTYNITIQAYDHGHPQQISEEHYELIIRPFNFHHPEFQFPVSGSTPIRLSTERATEDGLLVTAAGEFLQRIHATDEDGLNAGLVTFHIQGNEEATQFFDVLNEGDNYGQLILKNTFPDDIRQFQVTIRATDGGTELGPLWTDVTVTFIYVPTQGDPTFATHNHNVFFLEGEEGLTEQFQLPLAEDRKNHACTDDCLNIYYRILEGNSELFLVDAETNVIRLRSELDRQQAATHTVMVAASNSRDANNVPLQASILIVTVNVREANPRPNFVSELYTAGISTLDSIGRELFTVEATHSDNDVNITYAVNQTSMQVDPSLEAVRNSAFAMNAITGALSLNMQPSAAMHGMFDFEIVATDSAGATDSTQAQVYLISSLNRVTFVFINTLEHIENSRDFIAQTFTSGFGMLCNIDQVVRASDSSGVALDDMTEVRAHFIRNNTPVTAEEIEGIRSDTVLLRNIQMTLNTDLLVLQDFVTDISPEGAADPNRTAVYVLAALSATLAFLCIVLLLTFALRTRALNRRLEALSMTKYGSVDSGLNRLGLAPGTNKHAVEGSNPIWNESTRAPDFDAISDTSGDSDLIGIEDLPQFRDDYFPPGDTNSFDAIINPSRAREEPISTHGNNFGFNTSPFSPEFTNTQFRR